MRDNPIGQVVAIGHAIVMTQTGGIIGDGGGGHVDRVKQPGFHLGGIGAEQERAGDAVRQCPHIPAHRKEGIVIMKFAAWWGKDR